MPSFSILPAVFAGLAALLGALLGWILRGLEEQRRDRAALLAQHNAAQENVASALREVHALSGDVASQLEDHLRDVEGLQRELSELAVHSPGLAPVVQRLMNINLSVRDELNEAQSRLAMQSQMIDQQALEAQTDPLTGLPNRRALEWELQRRFALFESDAAPFSVAVLDVDHFKRLNDTHGHLAGDAVLRGVAECLEKHAPVGAMVARFGGEEFVVVFDGAIDPDRDGGIERCRAAISRHAFICDEKSLSVTASLGAATIIPAESQLSLLGRADQALYASKRGGRACSHWHDGRGVLRLTPIAKSNDPPERLIEAVRQHGPSETTASRESAPLVEVKTVAPVAAPILASAEAFQANVSRRVFDWRRGGSVLSVVVIHVDRAEHLKQRYGNTIHDSALRAVSQFVAAHARTIDDVARRDNGDLLLMLPGVSLRDAARTAYRIHKAVQKFELTHEGETVRVTLSVGVATCQEGDDSIDLLARSDKAVTTAVRDGRDHVYVHNGAIVAEVTRLFTRTMIEEFAGAT